MYPRDVWQEIEIHTYSSVRVVQHLLRTRRWRRDFLAARPPSAYLLREAALMEVRDLACRQPVS